jgi:hypothetical protein
VLQDYERLAQELAQIRLSQREQSKARGSFWPQRSDPFHRFSHFPTTRFGGRWKVAARPHLKTRLAEMLTLSMTNYAMATGTVSQQTLESLAELISEHRVFTVDEVLSNSGCAHPAGVRALTWLWKFDLVKIF